MTHTFTMRDIASVEVNLLDQIVSAFNIVLANNQFTFPDYHTTFTLRHGEPSRELRIMFESLKFNVVRISNQTLHGNKLVLDPALACCQFTYKALTKRFSRDSNTHPTDSNKGGLLIICEFCFHDRVAQCSLFTGPKSGGQLIGPVDDTNQHHLCFTDHILAGLGRSRYSRNLSFNQGKSEAELEEEWRTLYSYHCRTNCPRPHIAPFLPEDAGSDDSDDDLDTAEVLSTQRERSSGPRRSSHIASGSSSEATPASTSTSLSPLVQMLEVTGPAPFPMDQSSPTLLHNVRLPPLSTAPTPLAIMPIPALPPQPPTSGREPDFGSFAEFENHVNSTRCPNILSTEDFFSVEGDSVSDAATGLVVALMNAYAAKDVPLRAQRLQATSEPGEVFTGLIHPDDATLERIFSFQHWMFHG